VQELSSDHKPSNELETKRIVAAGGWVEFNRVNGKRGVPARFELFPLKRVYSARITVCPCIAVIADNSSYFSLLHVVFTLQHIVLW